MKVLLCLALLYSGITFANNQGSLDQKKKISNENTKSQNCEIKRRASAERYESFYEGRREAASE